MFYSLGNLTEIDLSSGVGVAAGDDAAAYQVITAAQGIISVALGITLRKHRVAQVVIMGGTEADFGYDQDPTNNIIPLRDIANLDGADDGVKFPINLPHCRPARIHYYVNVVRPIENLYVNVWLDWNRDGDWDDIMQCSWPEPVSLTDKPRIAKEWAVNNQMLCNLGAGIYKFKTPLFLCWHPLSGSSEAQPIWMRITLSARPVTNITPSSDAVGWGGSGPASGYWIGETEDYFFVPDTSRVESADLDCNRTVNIADLDILASQWLTEITE